MSIYKERFKQLVEDNVHREGQEQLMFWLENDTDFFETSASARYHSAFKEGLVIHSLNVYDRLIRLLVAEYGEDWQTVTGISLESVTIIALFHDVSKIFGYVFGEWKILRNYERLPSDLIYGTHAENSVYYLNKYISTSHLENICIRHHMGGKDDTEDRSNEQNTTDVFNVFPLALLTHIADMQASYIDERI